MFSLVRGVGRFPLTALALAWVICVLSGSSALAQGNVGAGASGGVAGASGGGSASAGIGGGLMGGGTGGMGPLGRGGVNAGNTGGLGGTGSLNDMGNYGYAGPGYGAPGLSPGSYVAHYGGGGYGSYGLGYAVHGPGPGDYGLGYPYACGHGMCCHYPIGYAVSQLSIRNWCTDVLGKECLYPYVADPYSDPTAGLGHWPPYAAPTVSAVNMAARRRDLGIDEEPAVDAAGVRGMKVAKVYPGTAAAGAGLQVGDVLHSINGYSTQQRGNLAWIIANAAPNNVLKMNVRSVRDGQEHTVTVQID